ncbi:Two-component signal transduction system YycFG, regulatory protein YycH [Alkalibacterium subtropicum]|uniref:Two-component signal transduction system YycFG, regulatory protein YycH n=1 Tax=Alkalibacterium subtropicum TaxID=753702 RepID=A0A1I1JSP8_9LACT|nr:two-component system activity regulator YycH [Alkalibacterium subtropicum]SFC48873.1 Two-component signal transduction system YycFG, regulatory protein YycH [Alkalibacterium subtropicum]
MIWSKIKQLLLVVLIGLSLFLSFQIWTTGVQLREPSRSGGTPVPASLVDRSRVEVFSPKKIIWHRNELDRKLEINTFYATDWAETYLSTTAFGEVQSPQRLSFASYQEYLNDDSWVEFVFDAPVPFGIFEDGFNDLSTDYENRTFTHVLMNKENPELAGFYDSHNAFLYQIDGTEYTEEILDELLYAEDNITIDVEAFEVNERFIYLPVDEQEVEYRDYLVERLPNNLFVLQFFSDTSEIDARRTGSTTRYIDLTTELRINDSTNTLTYLRQRSDMGQMTFSERLLSSYQTLTQVENWTEHVHYQGYVPETNEVTFQRYIQGYPIYSSQQYESMIEVTVVESGLTSLQVPVRVVQTPLTLTGERTKTLPSGADIIAQLEEAGPALQRIDDIRIGLTWTESQEDERVVHFEPHWYVESQGNWIEVNRFIETLEASLNGF